MKRPTRYPRKAMRRLPPGTGSADDGALVQEGTDEAGTEDCTPAYDFAATDNYASMNSDAADTGNSSETASLPAPDEDNDEATLQMTLSDHLRELRSRAIRCCFAILAGFIAVFYFAPKVRAIVTATLRDVLPPGGDITFAQLTEPFLVDMHIAFVLGFFVASPYIFYQIWAFIAPGLYPSERRYVVPVAVFCALFFLTGGAFCYMVVLPFTFKFFVTYGQDSAKPLITLAGMYKFSLHLLVAFGGMFEMPLFSFFLAKLRVVTAERLRAWRKYAILAMFIIAALITPPDVLSQLLLAGPLILLYEISILVAKWAAPKKNKTENVT